MVVGTLSLVQKGQTSDCSGYSAQWMQYAVDAVEIVVYGGRDIVKSQTSGFSGCSHTVDTVDTVCSAQWMLWNSGIWRWGHRL